MRFEEKTRPAQCADKDKEVKDWDDSTQWTVLDYRSADGMGDRVSEGGTTPLDVILLVFTGGLLLGFLGLDLVLCTWFNGSSSGTLFALLHKGDRVFCVWCGSFDHGSVPQNDVMMNGTPLGDSNGYLYYTVWTLASTVITIMVGAVCDTIGVKSV